MRPARSAYALIGLGGLIFAGGLSQELPAAGHARAPALGRG